MNAPVPISAAAHRSPRAGTAGGARRPRVLFLALVDNMGMERVIGGLAQWSLDCALLSPPGFWSASSGRLSRRMALAPHLGVWLGAVGVVARLERIRRDWGPDLIIPLDDVSSALLAELGERADISAELRALAAVSGGRTAEGRRIGNRSQAVALAARLGVRTPQDREVASEAEGLEAARAWGWPVVLKSDRTCGGVGVAIAHDAAEYAEAWRRHGPAAGWRTLKQALKRRVWRAAGAPALARAGLSIQSFAPGRMAMHTVSAWRGEVLEGVSFVAERQDPPGVGPSTVIRHIENREMERAAQAMVAALGWSGFVSFDFMIEADDGPAALIEVNFRPIGSVHLGARFGRDVCGALAARLGAERRAAPEPAALGRTVALFPKELLRQAAAAAPVGGLHHDVPWEDPPLLRRYRRRLGRRTQAGRALAALEAAGSSQPPRART